MLCGSSKVGELLYYLYLGGIKMSLKVKKKQSADKRDFAHINSTEKKNLLASVNISNKMLEESLKEKDVDEEEIRKHIEAFRNLKKDLR
jgi:hypothetical protein